jgi:hypothetical protein
LHFFYIVFFFLNQTYKNPVLKLKTILFTNLYSIKYENVALKKKIKNPLLAIVSAVKKQRLLSFKKSLVLFKHIFITILSLGRVFFDLKKKNRAILSFFFFLSAHKNLFSIYKNALYLTK